MIEFAKSMAGHDRNHIYLVTGKDERFVYLADGNVKLLAEPKKKNRKHIQIIHRLPDEVLGCLEQEITDLTVKRAIKNDTLRKYFPRSYTPKQMEDTIIKLLEQWQRKQQRQNER